MLGAAFPFRFVLDHVAGFPQIANPGVVLRDPKREDPIERDPFAAVSPEKLEQTVSLGFFVVELERELRRRIRRCLSLAK